VAQADPGRQQPLGRPHARVVHDLAAAAPQLHPPAADPVRAADLGLQPPRAHRGPARPRGTEQRARERKGQGRRMKVESLFLIFLGAFFGVIVLSHWCWGYEAGGSVMLLGATFLGFLPGAYYFF